MDLLLKSVLKDLVFRSNTISILRLFVSLLILNAGPLPVIYSLLWDKNRRSGLFRQRSMICGPTYFPLPYGWLYLLSPARSSGFFLQAMLCIICLPALRAFC